MNNKTMPETIKKNEDVTLALKGLAVMCERDGWVLSSLEVDQVHLFRVELRQGAHLYVATMDRFRRCIVERFLLSTTTVVVGRKGDRCRVDRVNPVFVERWKPEGFRSMMRVIARRTGLGEQMRVLADAAPKLLA